MTIDYRKPFRTVTLLILSAIAAPGILAAQVVPTDETIAEAVQTELQYSELVSYGDLRLTVDDGIVSFTGTVPSITSLRQIEDVTATVRGVRSIINRINIEAPTVPARQLRDNVSSALRRNAATELYQIDVSATDTGAVTLEGAVESWAELGLAEEVAGSVPGVRSVDNRISVTAAEHYRAVGEIRNDISERLHWDARVDDSLISILAREGGRVTLSGTVGSLAEKRLATSLAYVSGVKNVDAAHLEVESWANDEDRRLGADALVADSETASAIDRALTLDPRVQSNSITAEVVNGEVWLRGSVGSIAASHAAERTARNTRGVEHLHNLLLVQPLMLDDSDVMRRVLDSLADYGEKGVELTVANGQVRIAGDVNSTEQYRRIGEVVENTRGVESVINDLTVRGDTPRQALTPYMVTARVLMPRDEWAPQPPTERSLFDAVQSELFWSPFVDEDDVEIEVDDGTVTLRGTVDSMNELLAAAENAYEAGALIVRNELTVE